MGTLQIECPLCCEEIFDNKQSLRYHLLSIIDNILCPACGYRCESLLELTDHLNDECRQNTVRSTDENVESVEIKIEKDDEVDDSLNNSILAKALLSKNSNNKTANNVQHNENVSTKQTDDTTENTDAGNVEGSTENLEDGVYNCVGCGMSFTNLIEHINQYHDDEEVVVEMQNEMDEANTGTEIMKSITDGTAILSDDNLVQRVILADYDDEEEMDVDSNDSQEANENMQSSVRLPQLLNTIKQENCVDKDGRLYTRKVVQIEKFWDEKEMTQDKKSPIVFKYITDDDGNFTKINEGDESAENAIEIFQCSGCNVQFQKREQFYMHTCEPEIGSEYKCSMCETSFTNSQALLSHMKQHKKPKLETYDNQTASNPFICQICDTEFSTNKSLRLHRRMHDPVKIKEVDPPVEYGLTGDEGTVQPREMFQCKICDKSYDKTYEDIHMAYHSRINQYDCCICNRQFHTASNLEMHMRVHGVEKGHICNQCFKGFVSEESLEQHQKQHCSSRAYKCSYCSRRFARPHEKVKHERIHTGEKPHHCEICGKTFRVSYCLTLHMRTHSGYRPYVCQHCGKRFKAHSVYNHHLLTHSEARNYKCPYCPKAFKTGVQLAGHKNSHTKPFSCTHCNRPFASLYAVRAHMETHKRENNLKYNCYLCGASYARAFALRDHIKETHVDAQENETVALDIIEEGGYEEAPTSILPHDDISMVTLEMSEENNEGEEEIEEDISNSQ